MYPPVYEVYRELTEDVQTEKYLIPKGRVKLHITRYHNILLFVEVSWVVLSISGVHYNPEHWKNPEV